MKVYNVANRDETAFYSSGYNTRYEAEQLLKISIQHDPGAHVVEYETMTEYEALKAELDKVKAERDNLLSGIPRWISVEERLPEDKSYVLIMWNGVMQFGFYKPNRREWVNLITGYDTKYKVTHWMPLPEPPKEEA